MGICFSKKSTRGTRIHSKRVSNHSTTSLNKYSVNRWSRVRSSSVKKEKLDDDVLHEQAIAAAILLRQNGGVLPFDRSVSIRRGGVNGKCQQQHVIPRSCSSTSRRSLVDPMQYSQQLLNQVISVNQFGLL